MDNFSDGPPANSCKLGYNRAFPFFKKNTAMNKTFKLSALALAAALTVTACNKKDAAAPAASAPAASGAEASAIGTPAQQASYAMGVDIGRSLKQMKDQGTDIDLKVFNEAIQTMYDGKEPKMNEMQAQEVMLKFLQEQQTKAQAKRLEDAKTNLEKGDAFLKENASKEGVKTTASGLQYKVKTEGTGASPKATDIVTVEYEGRLIDGTVFDSSKQNGGQPVTFPVNQVIPGWSEAVQLMNREKAAVIELLAGVAHIDFTEDKPQRAIGAVGEGFEAFILVDESINKEQLMARFKKSIEAESAAAKKSEAKLSGKFAQNAPEDVVLAERKKLEECRRRIEKLQSYMESL